MSAYLGVYSLATVLQRLDGRPARLAMAEGGRDRCLVEEVKQPIDACLLCSRSSHSRNEAAEDGTADMHDMASI